MRLAKQIGVLFMAAWLTLGPIAAAHAAETESGVVTVQWYDIDDNTEFEEWMRGEVIQVKLTVYGATDTTYNGYATLDYNWTGVFFFMDTTGMSGNYHWAFKTWVPAQIISSGGNTAHIESVEHHLHWKRANDGFIHFGKKHWISINGEWGI